MTWMQQYNSTYISPFKWTLTEPNEIVPTNSLSAKTLFIRLLIYWFYEDWLLSTLC